MPIIEGAQMRPTIGRHPSGQALVVDPAVSGSLQNAIDNCVDNRGDIIMMLPGSHVVTEAVNFNKKGIVVVNTMIGSPDEVAGERFAILADESYTDGPVAIITENCAIQGLGFVSRDTGSTFFSGAALLIGGAAGHGSIFGVSLKNCRFPKWNVDNRIGLAIAGGDAVADVLVEDCTFEGVGADFDAGIYTQGAVQNLIVRRNYFRQCTAAIVCGAFAGGGPHAFIHENLVEDGKLLDTDGNAGTGLIAGNWLETATDTGSYDRAVATLQSDGWQFSGNHYSE